MAEYLIPKDIEHLHFFSELIDNLILTVNTENIASHKCIVQMAGVCLEPFQKMLEILP